MCFEIGKEYFYYFQSAKGHKFGPLRIVKRTKKSIWYVAGSDEPIRRKIYHILHVELFFVMGETGIVPSDGVPDFV